jgi:cytosolic carboxypeptidase protein 2/3
MLKKTQESRDIELYCDFHGHSRKKNIFMFGCSPKNPADRLKERIFP